VQHRTAHSGGDPREGRVDGRELIGSLKQLPTHPLRPAGCHCPSVKQRKTSVAVPDARLRGSVDDGAVTDDRSAVVVLELDRGEPISGRIHRPDEPATPFRGWLELAGMLDRLRAEAPSPRPPDRDSGA
jgi:hypothetical protein